MTTDSAELLAEEYEDVVRQAADRAPSSSARCTACGLLLVPPAMPQEGSVI
jgi:hypothetical protein